MILLGKGRLLQQEKIKLFNSVFPMKIIYFRKSGPSVGMLA